MSNAPLLTTASRLSASQDVANYAQGVAAHINGDWAQHYQVQILDQNWVGVQNTPLPFGQRTITTSGLTCPAAGSTATVSVASTATLVVGQITIGIWQLSLVSINSSTSITVENYGSSNTGFEPASTPVYGVGVAGNPVPVPNSSQLRLLMTLNGTDVAVVVPVVPFSTSDSLGLPPTIVAQPQNVNAVAGGTATFTIHATGDPALAYQWFVNSVSIPGAISPQLALANVSLSQNSSTYYCVVKNGYGVAQSSTAILSVVKR
jgi:hypothetical protein